MKDLFNTTTAKTLPKKQIASYNAEDIEVLEGLEAVRRRPGMYIGGTDENAMHHLVNEVLDNAMDEVVAGYATKISISLSAGGLISIADNGRGIPIDNHPKFPDMTALEVILTKLHSGGKFSSQAYLTSGGLNGVGISVVNALSDHLLVEVIKDKKIWQQSYSRGDAVSKLKSIGVAGKNSGTKLTFHPDEEIFGKVAFKPARIYALAKSKAYIYKGIEINWQCDPELLGPNDNTPENEEIYFPGGLRDYLLDNLTLSETLMKECFCGNASMSGPSSKIEWAIGWSDDGEGFVKSYCNTIPTVLGGSHEAGFRAAILKGLRNYAELIGIKKASQITIEDIFAYAGVIISVFIRDPQFQGQTKDKLTNTEVIKQVENAVKDHFDHFLSGNKQDANNLLNFVLQRAEERLNRKNNKDISRKSITQRLRLPGKLADCTIISQLGTEIFLVEGDSAGGSAKQARDRATQAILPLRGKILNVANSGNDKIKANQELSNLEIALGCGVRNNYNDALLRYEKVIIMTDADVDGAHIASLLMTYFFYQMPELIKAGHLYLAKPPLYRITQNNKTVYAIDDKEKERIISQLTKASKANIEVGRFKGLGEMMAAQLKETTMDKNKRVLLKVKLAEDSTVAGERVESLMGKNPELRFQFIHDQVVIKGNIIQESLDI